MGAQLVRKAGRPSNEWTLWVVAASCALHATEEYFTGWQVWARDTLGIVMPTSLFVVMNAVLVVIAVLTAQLGWRRPEVSLISTRAVSPFYMMASA